MTILEYIKNVKRKCDCGEGLVYWKKEYKRRIKAKGHWVNDFVQLQIGNDKYKTLHKYIAECEICGKFYFATEKRKDMIDGLKFLDFGYEKKL